MNKSPLLKFAKTVEPKIVRVRTGAPAYILALEIFGRLTPQGKKVYSPCGDDSGMMNRKAAARMHA